VPDSIGALVEKENRALPGKWQICSLERFREITGGVADGGSDYIWKVTAECRLGHERLSITGSGVNINGALNDLHTKAALWKEAFSG
jgi:hypothetical protein